MKPEDGDDLVRLRGVGKFYGERLILKKIELTAKAGEVLLVAGANGAGKSTLLKIMAGLIFPDQGRRFDLAGPGRSAYLGHKTGVYPKLTALDNLIFFAGLHGLKNPRPEAMAALERQGLSSFAADPAGTFSRGMIQRLSLARVFLLSPSLIYLDEPDTGLDVASRTLLRQEIAAAAAAGTAVVWVSHNPAADLALATRAVLLEKKTIAYLGPARDFPGLGLSGGQPC